MRRRLFTILAAYLIVDLAKILMVDDPYFVFGPNHSHRPPPHLGRVPPWLLLAYRELLCIAAVLALLQAYFNLFDLLQYYFLKLCFPQRAALWLHPSFFGSFVHVLDHGLTGFWSAFWHQSFRHQFLAPAAYLVKNGHLAKRGRAARLVAVFVSFLQSGLLHAAGSITSMRETKPWRQIVFFFLHAVGVVLEPSLRAALARRCPDPPKAVSRTANLLYVSSWMYMTGFLFADDFASSGVFLLEPFPISLLRWLGYSHATSHWLRWDGTYFPKWHSENRWWESGLAI